MNLFQLTPPVQEALRQGCSDASMDRRKYIHYNDSTRYGLNIKATIKRVKVLNNTG